MARGRGTVNKVILIGRLGADPQLKYTPSSSISAWRQMQAGKIRMARSRNAQNGTV